MKNNEENVSRTYETDVRGCTIHRTYVRRYTARAMLGSLDSE